jgi:DNA-binding transcriptional LysR family regulator
MLTLSGMGWGALPLHLIEKELKSGALQKLVLVDKDIQRQFDFHVFKLRSKIPGPVATALWQRLSALSAVQAEQLTPSNTMARRPVSSRSKTW